MSKNETGPRRWAWNGLFKRDEDSTDERDSENEASGVPPPPKWGMGVLNDKRTIEVPGSVLLLANDHNEPLGLRNAPARTSHSSLPTGMPHMVPPQPVEESKKKTPDGKIILEPQPEASSNDPLNWPAWRRDSALLSLGLFCMVGGGMTPVLAAGFTDVANDYKVNVSQVSLTTGLFMMGMGLGSVIFSPTAILWGKRPVYLFGAVLFILTSVWCALSPNFTSLILARIFQGIAVSPVECLPSATIAEIFFLHERAFRIGIYTLLLLGGKNLVPLVSAAVVQRLGWRWAFWIVAIVVAFCGFLLVLFVPESFWDRSPVPKQKSTRPNFFRRLSSRHSVPQVPLPSSAEPLADAHPTADDAHADEPASPSAVHPKKTAHVGFGPEVETAESRKALKRSGSQASHVSQRGLRSQSTQEKGAEGHDEVPPSQQADHTTISEAHSGATDRPATADPSTPQASPPTTVFPSPQQKFTDARDSEMDSEKQSLSSQQNHWPHSTYTTALREQPPRSFVEQLKPFHGRLNKDKWHKVAVRPLILYGYPSVLWSSVVYACSVGWLIVISESVAVIYRNPESYNFSALQTGMVYLSPFIGGILGTAVAGKVSDIVVKAMARRNGGLYEPEFRLVMVIPIAITTVIGLMGFGWSAEVHDNYMVPTVFFGIVSFGCSLGSTTAITFCVDSYRQYAGEALVTLNFTKNIFHGLVFSLFVTGWLEHDGSKPVYIWIGVIQLIMLLSSIPMYIYGKRARMWTVRKNFMERF